MPRLWSETIAAHRDAVTDAILDAVARIVAADGVTAVSMSGVAAASGVGRATLYKYFPDRAALLRALHTRQAAAHVLAVRTARDTAPADGRLAAVLHAYAAALQERPHDVAAGAMHRQGGHDAESAHSEVTALLEELIGEEAGAGRVRRDVAVGELVAWAAAAMEAAAGLDRVAAERIAELTLDGLRGGSPSG